MHVIGVFCQVQNSKHYWTVWVSTINRKRTHLPLIKKKHSFISLVNEDLFFIYIVYLVSIDGNGFKTSTMRLGADVIVFSRSHGIDGRRLAYFLKSAPTISICSNIDELVYCLDICVEQIHTHFCCTYIWDNLCAFTRFLGCFLSSDYDTPANCKLYCPG